jgi:hypothetical protein
LGILLVRKTQGPADYDDGRVELRIAATSQNVKFVHLSLLGKSETCGAVLALILHFGQDLSVAPSLLGRCHGQEKVAEQGGWMMV